LPSVCYTLDQGSKDVRDRVLILVGRDLLAHACELVSIAAENIPFSPSKMTARGSRKQRKREILRQPTVQDR
jgi:hypothetical protein